MIREARNKNNKIGINIFFFFLVIYLFFMSGHMGGDSFNVYLTTESIILDGNLVLNDHPGREFGIQEMKRVYDTIVGVNKGEKIYSRFQLGEVFLQIPFFLIGYFISLLYKGIHGDYITMFFVSMSNCFITALLCFVFYKLLKLFSISDKISILVTIALGLSTFIFPFSRQGFREPLTGLCILSGVYYIIKYRKLYSEKYLLYSGIFIGYGIFTRFDTLYVLPPFLLYILLINNKKRLINKILYFISPAFAFMFINLIINYSIRGNLIKFGYSDSAFDYVNFNFIEIISSIYGLFFSSGRSFFLYAPVAILFFTGISKFTRLYRNEAIFFLSIIFINILFYSMISHHSFGGSCWGPRYQYSIVPFFLVPVGLILHESNKKIYIFITLIVLGILIQLPAIFVNSSMLLHKYRDYYNKKFQLLGKTSVSAFGDIEFIIFLPRLSPILWGYYQIGSAISSSVGKESFKIPVFYYNDYIYFSSIDFWDIWFMNVFRIVKGGYLIKILTVIFVTTLGFLILKIGLSLKRCN